MARSLNGAIENPDVLRAARAQQVLRRWEEAVGIGLAQKSRPDRYDKGTVWVSVEGAAWAQELRMMRELILERLGNMADDPSLFEAVRFGVRPIIRDDPVEEAVAEEPPVPLETAGLTIREIAQRRLEQWRDEKGN